MKWHVKAYSIRGVAEKAVDHGLQLEPFDLPQDALDYALEIVSQQEGYREPMDVLIELRGARR